MLSASAVRTVKTDPPTLVSSPPAPVASVNALWPSSVITENTSPPTVVTNPATSLNIDLTIRYHALVRKSEVEQMEGPKLTGRGQFAD